MSERPNNVLDLREEMKRRQQKAEQASGFGTHERPSADSDDSFEYVDPDDVFASSPDDIRKHNRPGLIERIKSWFSESRRRSEPSFHTALHEQHTLKEDGLLYNSVVAFGWVLEKLAQLALVTLRAARFILLGPIKVLDIALDFFAKQSKRGAIFGAKKAHQGTLVLVKKIRRYELRPPYQWHRSLATFLLIAFAFVAPIKIYFDEVPKIVNATQKVLGTSTKAVQYFGLFQEVKGFLPAAVVGKEFLGLNGPRRYLVVFQNNAELRPTGGFMGSYAVIDIKNGALQKIDVPPGGFYDLKGYNTYKVEAPEPFHMFSPYWQIWNTNWFASFPLSAKKIAEFYERSGAGSTVDGVVTLTPNVIEEVLTVTGPIDMPKYDTVISAENFRTQTQTEVELEYDKVENSPKAFIGDLLPILADRIITLVNEGETKELLTILDTAFSERHILMYSNNGIVQESIRELGWDGEIKPVPQDYLQIVHTNIGGGKTDLVIKDVIAQDVFYESTGDIIHTVSLTRTHNGDPLDFFEGHNNLDYVRFYVPFGSQLISADGFLEDDITERFKTTKDELSQDVDLLLSQEAAVLDVASQTEIYTESNKTVFANWLSLKAGQTKTVTVSYRLPYKHTDFETHHMYWQKQSGSIGGPLTTTITLPQTMTFENWVPQSSNVQMISENQIRYSNDLRTDRLFSFTTSEKPSEPAEAALEEGTELPQLPE